MRKLTFSPKEFGFIVATRAALGFGLGLLLAPKLEKAQCRALGLTLLALGVATTIPAASLALGQLRRG